MLIIAGGFYYQAHKRAGKPLDIKEGKQVENIVLNAKIKTAKGDINLKLFPEVAPMTVTNKVNFKMKAIKKDIEGHYLMVKGYIQEEDIIMD